MVHLNNEQQKAVRHVDGPMLVLAGPGSGKTAVLTQRVSYLIDSAGVEDDSILVLTFSNKAANEMRRRFIASFGKNTSVHFGTIHSIFFQVLKQYNNYSKDNIISLSQRIAIVRDVGNKLSAKANIDNSWCVETLNQISFYKNTGKIPAFFSDNEKESFIRVMEEYKKRLKKERLIDFDDMISDCLELFSHNPVILSSIREKYKYILVDEFQDCNHDQYQLIKFVAGERNNLFVVGDDDQSIYGFRGADARIVLNFLEDNPNCGVIELVRNYRCAKEIIDVSFNLINHNLIRKEKAKQLHSTIRGEGKVCVIKTEDAFSEAKIVGDIVSKLKGDGVALNDISVLYRTETISDYLQEYLTSVKINNNKTDSVSLFGLESVKDIIAYLYISQHTNKAPYYHRILNKPDRGLVRECIGNEPVSREKMIEYYNDDMEKSYKLKEMFNMMDFISDLSPYAAVNYLMKKTGLIVPKAFGEFAKKFDSIKSLLEGLQKCTNAPNNSDGLILQTIHASKGLEYDTVIVIGLQEGLMPHNKAGDEEAVEEERRLMYVAMTRAKKRLYLIARGKEAHGKKYSRFIYEMGIDQSSIESNTPSSRNSSKASSTASYSSSSSI